MNPIIEEVEGSCDSKHTNSIAKSSRKMISPYNRYLYGSHAYSHTKTIDLSKRLNNSIKKSLNKSTRRKIKLRTNGKNSKSL